MRPKPEDYGRGSMEYLATVRGTSENPASLETLVIWLEEAGLRKRDSCSDTFHISYTRACWSVKTEKSVEFDLYNTAQALQYMKVIPHRTDTTCHRQRVGLLLYVLVMSGYKIDVYKNEELKGIQFKRQLDWQI